jgi:class 3 adenylate cyclase/Tfp pilus assembly protein PilF
MKNTTLILFLFFGFSYSNAQVNLDSMYNVWQERTKTDSTRISAFTEYIYKGYLYSKPDTAIVLANELLEFSIQKDNVKGQIEALGIKGVGYQFKSDYTASLANIQKGYDVAEAAGDKQGMANALNAMGITYFTLSDYSTTLDYYQRSLKIYQEIGDNRGISSAYNNMGHTYETQGEYVKALDYNERSLKINKELGLFKANAATYDNIGTIYREQKNYPKAFENYQLGLAIFEQTEDKRGIAHISGNMGATYLQQGEVVKAMEYSKRALKNAEEIGNKFEMAKALNNIGIIHKMNNNNIEAMDYFKRGLEAREEINNKNGIIESLNNIGEVQLKLGNFYKAIENCKKALDLGKQVSSIRGQKESCDCLYQAYKASGDSSKGLAYIEQLLVFNDSLGEVETSKRLQQMEFTKTKESDSLVQVEKESKVELAHQIEVQQKDKNRNIAVGLGVFFLLLAGGFYGRSRIVQKSKAIIEKEKDRSENLLLNILPAEIAEELKIKGSADARDFDLVSILFTDFKGFTETSAKLTAKELIGEINHCFEAFDHICEKFRIEKIKTIGDAYMAAGGLPVPSNDSVKNTVLAALEMQFFISNRILEKRSLNETPFEMRLGIHTGPVVAGIVGVKKFQYDVWGDTVNTASRIESKGEVGKVNISENTYNLIKNDPDFLFESRGKIDAKGKGKIEMYFVTKVKQEEIHDKK